MPDKMIFFHGKATLLRRQCRRYAAGDLCGGRHTTHPNNNHNIKSGSAAGGNMKKVISVLLCLAMAASLVGCGTKSVSSSSQSGSGAADTSSNRETVTAASPSEFKDISDKVGKTEGDRLVLSCIYGQIRQYYVFTYNADGTIKETIRYYQYTNETLYNRILKFQFENNDNVTDTADIFMKDESLLTIGIREKDPTKGLSKATKDETEKYYTSGEADRTYTVVR